MSVNRAKALSAAFLAAMGLAACAPMEGRETSGQYVDDATVISFAVSRTRDALDTFMLWETSADS